VFAVVDQHDARREPRHRRGDVAFERAVRHVDRVQRVVPAELAFLANVDERDLACVAEPVEQRTGLDAFDVVSRNGHEMS
jgi:hypothetical protein